LRLIIRDGTEPGGGGGLAFDLPEVLGALGEKAQSWVWRGRDIQYVSRDERDVAVIQELAAGRALAGADLIAGLEQLLQIIDGEFEATEPGEQVPAVVIRAVDSSWWEVLSDDAAVLAAIRQRFGVVEEDGTDAA
jgi:hypothetical protein